MRLSDDKPAFLENVARFGEGGTSALSAIRVWWIGSPTSVASGPVGNLSMRRRDTDDDDSLPVMVPRSDMVLVPTSASRVRWLREHLIAALRELRMAKHQERIATPVRPEPTGFAAKVARTACSLCKGWCCRNGGDDAFLDDRTLARVRLARPAMDERAVLRLYLERVPTVAYQNSCIFHGKRGCALDRSLRADICNSYFCGGLACLHENQRGCSDEGHRRRGRQDADFARAYATKWRRRHPWPLGSGI